MTFNKAAWAIDGATVNSALARTEAYAANSGSEGIVQGPDLKVTALDVAGNGVQIAPGAALILNRYLGLGSDQMYTVSNPDIHIVGAADMPASNASPINYIVGISVGDPEYSQAGHPWMQATDPPAGQEATFTYVRPIVVTESAFAARTYPALPLARIAIPANTTTITNAMITDLRWLSRPRTWLAQSHNSAPTTLNPLNVVAPTWERFPNVPILTVRVPTWAVKAKVMGFIEGLRLDKELIATIQPYVEGTSLVGADTNVNEYIPANNKDRRAYNLGGEIDVRSIAGTDKTFSVRAQAGTAGSTNGLFSDIATTVMLSVYFEEVPT